MKIIITIIFKKISSRRKQRYIYRDIFRSCQYKFSYADLLISVFLTRYWSFLAKDCKCFDLLIRSINHWMGNVVLVKTYNITKICAKKQKQTNFFYKNAKKNVLVFLPPVYIPDLPHNVCNMRVWFRRKKTESHDSPINLSVSDKTPAL